MNKEPISKPHSNRDDNAQIPGKSETPPDGCCNPKRTSTSFWRKISLAEWSVAGLLTVAAACLHWVYFRHAGVLWRDETGIVNIALLPSWGEVWKTLPHDHCPILFPALVRVWSKAGAGATDQGLRMLGLGIGLAVLAAFWITNRMMGRGLPLFSLSLAALNFTVITFGDSLRAYGLATACILLTLGLVWRFTELPGWRRGLLAGFAAVLSVQTLYQNAFLVLAVCVAGIVLCISRRQYRPAMAVLSIGFVAALSLTPYIKPLLDAQSWWVVSKTGDGFHVFLDRMIQITGGFSSIWFYYVWFVSVIIAAVLGIGQFFRAAATVLKESRDVCFFAGVALAAGFAGYGIFFKLAGLPVQPWYCIPLIGLIAVCCDVILPRMHQSMRLGVLVVAVVSFLLAWPTTYSNTQQRRTNGDQVAATLAQNISPDDFVIVHPWYYGLTFARYYHGSAVWKTLPPLEDYRFHRYDLIKQELQMTNAIQPVLGNVEVALRSGHRVWIVGEVPMPKPNTPPPVDLPPAPNGPAGWLDVPYTRVWGLKLGYVLASHTTNITRLVNPSTNALEPWEDIGLTVVSGWNDPALTNLPQPK
ncbi:MAG: hypothetical protein PHY43_06945 [Verrucomicrobiales bacterium]|nr:hypothetical protein [Verrucomicrobiales bacterium]